MPPVKYFQKLMNKLQQFYHGMIFALFDDILSTTKTLIEQKLILGLLTNLY